MKPVPFILVDDLEENLISLEALLRRDDLLILKARSGDEALELLLEHDVALALVDVQMPGLDGLETTRRLRRSADRSLRSLPVIAVTAHALPGDRERCLAAGADDYISKPYRLQDMVDLIQTVINAKRRGG